MESMLGFEKVITDIVDDDQEKSSSSLSVSASESSSSPSEGYKLVPWLNWEEWECVRDSLFSDSPDNIAFAIKRISTWRSRGCLPVVIDVTASIIEIQQKDPFYRKDLVSDDAAIHSDQMLAMLYCMAILRLVNCAVEKTRKRTEISIAEAAGAIGIPRTLIDIRHEGSHRDLPALALVRDSAVKTIHWLKSYYWVPQSKKIPFQRDGTANIRKEIKSKLRELAHCLITKQSAQPDSSVIKGKRGKHCEQLCGRSKFFSLVASKLQSSKSRGSRRHSSKILKILVRLYSSFSSEVLSVLLEFLLKALNSSNLVDLPLNYQAGHNICLLDDWKLVITKFSNEKPELLLILLKAVLNLIETHEAMKYGTGTHLTSWEYQTKNDQIEQLSSLVAWLVGQLKRLKPLYCKDVADKTKVSLVGMNVPNAILLEILRKCLLISTCGNKQLMDSALHLAQLMGDSSLMEKLNKLSLLHLSALDITKENSLPCLNNLLIQHDEAIHQATKKLELIKLGQKRSKAVKTKDGEMGGLGRWVLAKSWNPCPIGMLPCDLGSSGCLPVLNCNYDDKKHVASSERQTWELKQCSNVRDPGCDSPIVEKRSSKREGCSNWDGSTVKKMRETVVSFECDDDVSPPKDIEGCVMENLVWKKLGKEEKEELLSGVQILV